ncbi:hypothetical protein DPMN_083135 [Dreissena polymorpha]|uniref:Uncharacterized protein n=1 Tax=Dreissena polymorpha TaxID=45954 RepID=A0A9D4BHZ0_DREPO|nr:hypothetical protein DPMN_083135 [Dreissena polymorpha]
MLKKREDKATHADHFVDLQKLPTSFYNDRYSNTIRDIAREETHVLTDPSDVIHN